MKAIVFSLIDDSNSIWANSAYVAHIPMKYRAELNKIIDSEEPKYIKYAKVNEFFKKIEEGE